MEDWREEKANGKGKRKAEWVRIRNRMKEESRTQGKGGDGMGKTEFETRIEKVIDYVTKEREGERKGESVVHTETQTCRNGEIDGNKFETKKMDSEIEPGEIRRKAEKKKKEVVVVE